MRHLVLRPGLFVSFVPLGVRKHGMKYLSLFSIVYDEVFESRIIAVVRYGDDPVEIWCVILLGPGLGHPGLR